VRAAEQFSNLQRSEKKKTSRLGSLSLQAFVKEKTTAVQADRATMKCNYIPEMSGGNGKHLVTPLRFKCPKSCLAGETVDPWGSTSQQQKGTRGCRKVYQRRCEDNESGEEERWRLSHGLAAKVKSSSKRGTKKEYESRPTHPQHWWFMLGTVGGGGLGGGYGKASACLGVSLSKAAQVERYPFPLQPKGRRFLLLDSPAPQKAFNDLTREGGRCPSICRGHAVQTSEPYQA